MDRPYTVIATNTSTEYEITETSKLMYFGMEKMPNALKHNVLVSFSATLACKGYATIGIDTSKDGFNPATLTYNNKPASNGEGYFWVKLDSDTISNYTVRTNSSQDYLANLFKHNTIVVRSSSSSILIPTIKTVLANGSTRPYFTITYDNATKVTSQITYKSGPSSGYYNPRNAATFTWDYEKVGNDLCADETFDQTSAVFYWKRSTDESYTSVSISGNTKNVTIPANTFPAASTIQWYVSGTDEDNTTTQTPVYSFSTAAGSVTSKCIDPVGQVIDGSAPYTFVWTIASADGQPASRTVFQWKQTSGSTWSTLFDESRAVTSYTVPGGTFPAGSIDWQILAYNIDGTLGNYTPASFVSVAAPDPVLGLAATAVPFSTISWQSSGQEAYQIIVDGNVIEKAFGPTVYSYDLIEPLTDGSHTIAVIIQGIYGLWSQPSEITVNIQNVPTETIALSTVFDVDASLSWDSEQELTYIYRDGKRIGATNRQTFTDRVSLGYHEYYVLSPLPDGNYNISDTISGTTAVECSQISLLSGGDWLELEHCKQLPMQTYTRNRTVSVRHYCGAVYPVAEVSTYYDKSGSFNVLFEDGDDALVERFESLMGEIVVMKNRRNNLLVGIFSTLDKRVEDYYVDCDFIVQQTEWNDFVDETNN